MFFFNLVKEKNSMKAICFSEVDSLGAFGFFEEQMPSEIRCLRDFTEGKVCER